MQQPQFGRRGAMLNGEAIGGGAPAQPQYQPQYQPQPQPRPEARESHIDEDGTYTGWRWIVVTLIGTIVVLAWLEALFSGTALITPINSTVEWIMRGIGLAVGIVTIALIWQRIHENSPGWRAWLTVAMTPLLFAVMFDGIAWRVADWTAFGFSQQPFVKTYYPIKYVSHGRKGRRDSIEINPFHTGTTDIPIPDEQYDQLWRNHDGMCVGVWQRENAAGAIQIQTDGEYTMGEPEWADVTDCGAPSESSSSRSARPASGSNPWAKD